MPTQEDPMNPRSHTIGLAAVAFALAACATPEPAAPPTPMPVDTPVPVVPTTVPPAAMAAAGPAVQVVPLQPPDAYFVGVPAAAAVLAADSDGLSAVELHIDGQLTDSVPFASPSTLFQGTLNWTPSHAGPHEAMVSVRDGTGAVTQAKWITVDVLDPPAGATPVPAATPSGDTVPPSVSIAPASTEVSPGEDVDIAVNAVDQGGVVTMELYADDSLVETWNYDASQGAAQTSVFHTFTYRSVPEGQYDVYVKAYDTAGNVGQSATERIDVNP
jgi:hypothetical protein